MIEKLDLWHSSDVEARKKVNDIIDEIEKIKLAIGLDVDTDENL